jgi:hypothetical protein
MWTGLRRPAILLAGSWLGAFVLLGLNEWSWRPFARGGLSHVAEVFVMIGVSLLAVVLPVVALAWLILVWLEHWHAGKVLRVSVLLLPVAAILYVLGGWSRGLYGLDPPYAFFWVGVTLELTALVVPFVIGVWASGAVVARRATARVG